MESKMRVFDWISRRRGRSQDEAFSDFLALKKTNGPRPATIKMYELNVNFFYRPASEDGVVCAEWDVDERKSCSRGSTARMASHPNPRGETEWSCV